MNVRCLLTAVAMTGLVVLEVAAQQSPSTPLAGTRGFGTAMAQPMTGWWFRVNTAATRASKIVWHVDTVPATATVSDWWFHSGEGLPSVILKPSAVQSAPVVAVRVTTEPPDAVASVCAFFKSNAVQLIEFTGQASHQLNSAQQDQRCMSSR